jgi:lysophospholipase L1-like esterase
MKVRAVFFRMIAILAGTATGLLILWSWRFFTGENRNSGQPKPVHQAARYVYHLLPFYFKLAARPVQMFIPEAFSELPDLDARHNSECFRTPEYTIAHPPNTLRVVVLGDSFTWGQGVRMEESFPYLLEEHLNKRCKRHRHQVISMGVQGHRLVDNVLKLMVHAQTLNPDLVVIQMYTNDVDLYDYLTILYFQGDPDLIPHYLATESKVLSSDSTDWKAYIEAVHTLRAWSEQKHVPVAFVAFPIIDRRKRGRNFDHYNIPENKVLTDLEKIIRPVQEEGFAVLDLTQAFRERAGNRYLAVSKMDAHPNPLAHSIAAEALLEFLQRQRLIGCDGFTPQPAGPHWKEEDALRKIAAERWHEMNQSYKAQVVWYQDLRKLYPEDPWITVQYANVLEGLGKWNDAWRLYSSLPEICPVYAAPWYNLANCGGDSTTKKKLFEQTLQVTPDHTAAMEQLAGLLVKNGETAEACTLFSRLSEIPVSQQQYTNALTMMKKLNCVKSADAKN